MTGGSGSAIASVDGARRSAIWQLMADLGRALSNRDGQLYMLGGGAPASIPEAEALWLARFAELAVEPRGLLDTVSSYDPPAGLPSFREAFAAYLQRKLGLPIKGSNVCVTLGSQTGMFALLRVLTARGGRVVFPMLPEYVGYADQLPASQLVGCVALLERTGARRFRYRLDRATVSAVEDVAAYCMSRPTNPTGGVLLDEDFTALSELAERRDAWLVVDAAYGDPLPGIVERHAATPWNERTVYTFSLSKLGLPGARTGVVVGPPALIDELEELNAVLALSPASLGQRLVAPLLGDGRLDTLIDGSVRPFYAGRRKAALAALESALPAELPWAVHEPDGAFFLWLWLPGLDVGSAELYEKLWHRGVVVVPGHHFSPGGCGDAGQLGECLRLSFAVEPERFVEAARVLAEVLSGVGCVARRR